VALLSVSVGLVTRASAAQTPELRPDSRMVYVSSSLGSDTNDGLTPATPKKTLVAAVALLRDGHPDWLLLRRGDEWTEGLGGFDLGGRSAGEPMVITTFGLGSEPAKITPADGVDPLPFGEHVVTLNISVPNSGSQAHSGGWTEFTPSADTRVIYVSASEGNDATGVVYDLLNADHAALLGEDPMEPVGTVRAFRSLSAAYNKLRDGKPDWMLLKRGDTWVLDGVGFGTNNWQKSGRDRGAERMVVGAYGSLGDPRPKVLTDPARRGLYNTGSTAGEASHLAFASFHLEPNGRQPDQSPVGIRWFQDSDDVLFEDLYVGGYASNIEFFKENGSIRRDIVVRRCVIVDAWSTTGHSQGIYAKDVEGLTIEECLIDHNGWNESIAAANPTTFNHNMYLSTTNTGVVVRNNISLRASATGCQARSGGEILGNIFQANPFGLNFGWTEGVALPHDQGSVGLCADNIVIDTENRGYGQWGIAVGNIGAREMTPVRGNLLVGRDGQLDGLVISGPNNYGIHGLEVLANVVYDFDRPLRVLGVPGEDLTDVVVADNVLQQVGGGDRILVEFRDADPSSETAFSRNRYSSELPAGRWFNAASDREMGVEEWSTLASEHDAQIGRIEFPDVSRDLGSYAGWLGHGSSLASFIEQARQQRRGHWREELTAQAAAAWIREGFGLVADSN